MAAAGVDLAVVAPSQVVMAGSEGSEAWKVSSTPEGFVGLVKRLVTRGVRRVVIEATSMTWFMMGVAVARSGADLTCHRVSGLKTKALRRFVSEHCRSDLVDAATLELMSRLDPALAPLELPRPETLALRRLVTLRHKRSVALTAEKNRVGSLCQWALAGFTAISRGTMTRGLLAILERWPDPRRLARARVATIAKVGGLDHPGATRLRQAAREVVAFYGGYLDWEGIAFELTGHLELISHLETELAKLDREIERRHQTAHPQDVVMTIPGIGPVVAAVIRGVVGEIGRFPNLAALRGFTGLTPRKNASGTRQSNGSITKAGPAVLRWALFIAAETARQWDPDLAALYWRLRLRRVHHTAATVAVANHLVGRIWATLRDNRPYIYRDLDGRPISHTEAGRIARSLKPPPELIPPPRRRKGGPPSTPNTGKHEAQPSLDQVIQYLLAAQKGA